MPRVTKHRTVLAWHGTNPTPILACGTPLNEEERLPKLMLMHVLARKARGFRGSWPALIACWLIGFTYTALATEVYQWRDPDGRIQFGDKPPSVGAKPVEIKHAPAPSIPIETAAARQERTERLLNEYATERSEREAERADEKAALTERQRVCAEARDRFYDVEDAGYLYLRDAAGGKKILPDVALRREQDRARAEVKRACAGAAGDTPH